MNINKNYPLQLTVVKSLWKKSFFDCVAMRKFLWFIIKNCLNQKNFFLGVEIIYYVTSSRINNSYILREIFYLTTRGIKCN